MAEITITGSNFDTEVMKSDKPVLIDFWAAWCGPCRMVAPTVEKIAEEYSGRVVVGKVNIDEQRELAVRFGVAAIPTLMVFKNGKMTASAVGVRTKEEIEDMFD